MVASLLFVVLACSAYVGMTINRHYFRGTSLVANYLEICAFTLLAVAALVEAIFTFGWKRWSRAGAPPN